MTIRAAGCLEPPKELYEKFDEFLGLLFELDAIRETLYNPVNQRIAATLDMMDEEKGFRINTNDGHVTIGVRFERTDDGYKVLERSITIDSYLDPQRLYETAIKVLIGFCGELVAAKVPEPEVLIVEETPKGKIYKISREWMNWFRAVFPHYPPEAPYEMGGLRAIKKHFQEGPTDRIERVPETILNSSWYGATDRDLEIEFYRVTRVKL